VARRKTVKKRKTKKKRKRNYSFRDSLPVKSIILILLCVGVLSGAFYGLKYVFLNSSYFEIKEIEINNVRGYSFSSGERKLKKMYLDHNIFTVDLKNVAALIKKDFPQTRKVEVRRRLPDKLEIDVITRAPIAVIDAGGGVVIDKEGVVLTIGEDTPGLIKIRGIKFFLNIPSRGEKIKNRSLSTALLLAEGIQRKMHSETGKIDYMDVSDKNNVILVVSGVEIKMGVDDFLRKITKLKEILKDPDIDMVGIRYIDLRFKDVVISPR